MDYYKGKNHPKIPVNDGEKLADLGSSALNDTVAKPKGESKTTSPFQESLIQAHNTAHEIYGLINRKMPTLEEFRSSPQGAENLAYIEEMFNQFPKKDNPVVVWVGNTETAQEMQQIFSIVSDEIEARGEASWLSGRFAFSKESRPNECQEVLDVASVIEESWTNYFPNIEGLDGRFEVISGSDYPVARGVNSYGYTDEQNTVASPILEQYRDNASWKNNSNEAKSVPYLSGSAYLWLQLARLYQGQDPVDHRGGYEGSILAVDKDSGVCVRGNPWKKKGRIELHAAYADTVAPNFGIRPATDFTKKRLEISRDLKEESVLSNQKNVIRQIIIQEMETEPVIDETRRDLELFIDKDGENAKDIISRRLQQATRMDSFGENSKDSTETLKFIDQFADFYSSGISPETKQRLLEVFTEKLYELHTDPNSPLIVGQNIEDNNLYANHRQRLLDLFGALANREQYGAIRWLTNRKLISPDDISKILFSRTEAASRPAIKQRLEELSVQIGLDNGHSFNIALATKLLKQNAIPTAWLMFGNTPYLRSDVEGDKGITTFMKELDATVRRSGRSNLLGTDLPKDMLAALTVYRASLVSTEESE